MANGPLSQYPSMSRTFLTAEWKDLILANYAVEPSLLEPHLPEGLELDLFKGQPVCSLVGFRFRRTRVMGVRWPGYVNFPEINLRFYVREKRADRRGVVFVRELVRSRTVAGIARRLYNEPYVKAKISEQVSETETERGVGYRFSYNGGNGGMHVTSDAEAYLPATESTEHWFKEHQWGYGQSRRNTTLRYEVRHPVWACHRVRKSEITVDWSRIYGGKWAHMREAEPLGVVLAAGSEIQVRSAEHLSN